MEKLKPIKRSTALVALSKDHHFALLLVWKIREGFKKPVEPSRIGRYVTYFFDADLRPHFKAEEELLFNRLPQDHALRARAEEEHRNLNNLVETLRNNPGDEETLKQFSLSLESHIRFEERELFNYLQEIIPEEGLAEIAGRLKQRTPETPVPWTDIFWEKK
jgi:hemerythrin-like domain-containing protein